MLYAVARMYFVATARPRWLSRYISGGLLTGLSESRAIQSHHSHSHTERQQC